MTTKKETANATPSVSGWLVASFGRLVRLCLTTGLVVGVLAAGVYAIWSHVREHVTNGEHYRLATDQITLTPAQPAWIRADIRAEVLLSASLDENLTILDGELAERFYKAFSLHPWIARVERVVKLAPSGVKVELIYRRPICMVEVPGGLYAIDADAYLLPSADFTAVEAKRYPRLAGVVTMTEGPVGTQWQDPHVQSAARIAAAFGESWSSLGLLRITPTPAAARLDAERVEYDLFTAKGTCIRWGPCDESPRSGEPTEVQKRQRLEKYAQSNGSLEGREGPQQLDLRRGAEIISHPFAKAVEQPDPTSSIPVARRPMLRR